MSLKSKMSNYKVHRTRLKTLRQSDAGFTLIDGIVTSPRAGFEISNLCPGGYKMILQECINYGWIKPVATVYDHELTFDILKDSNV